MKYHTSGPSLHVGTTQLGIICATLRICGRSTDCISGLKASLPSNPIPWLDERGVQVLCPDTGLGQLAQLSLSAWLCFPSFYASPPSDSLSPLHLPMSPRLKGSPAATPTYTPCTPPRATLSTAASSGADGLMLMVGLFFFLSFHASFFRYFLSFPNIFLNAMFYNLSIINILSDYRVCNFPS